MARLTGGQIGMWIAIWVLGITAMVLASLRLHQVSTIQAIESRMIYDDPESLYEEQKNENIGKLLAQERELKENFVDLQYKQLFELEDAYRLADAQNRHAVQLTMNSSSQIDISKDTNENLDRFIAGLRQKAEVVKRREDKDLVYDRKRYRALKSDLEEERDKKDRNQTILTERNEYVRAAALKRYRDQQSVLNHLEAMIDETEAKLRKRDTFELEDVDGKILDVDVGLKFVVVNVGEVDGAKRGMKFEVVRWYKNRFAVVGVIELTRIDPTTSNGVIIDRPSVVGVDDKSGYESPIPEERYSPYASGGENGNEVIKLRTVRRPEESSMDPMTPILSGDMIRNPLFDPRENPSYYIAGERLYYDRDRIKQVLESHGGTVVDTFSIDVDFVVIGRILPDSMAQSSDTEKKSQYLKFKKVLDTTKQYGVPIKWESRFMRFISP